MYTNKPLTQEIQYATMPPVTSDVFPVLTTAVPKLYAYQLDLLGGNPNTIGGKLAIRMKKDLNGHWTYTSHRLITDKKADPEAIQPIIEQLWKTQAETFRNLTGIRLDPEWTPTAQAMADFVARSIEDDQHYAIRAALANEKADLGNARVEREAELRGWVVNNQPAVSVSVSSHLVLTSDLSQHLKTLKDPEDIVGLWAEAKGSNFKGEIVTVIGQLKDHRKRLLSLATKPESIQLLQKAPDDELVVKVARSGHDGYDYLASALRPIVRMENFQQFRINSFAALKAMRLEPAFRKYLVDQVIRGGSVGKWLGPEYESSTSPQAFLQPHQAAFKEQVKIGRGQVVTASGRIMNDVRRFGIFKKGSSHQTAPIRIGVINAIDKSDGTLQATDQFRINLLAGLKTLGFEAYVIREELSDTSRLGLENALNQLKEHQPDLVLALFPGQGGSEEDEYNDFKHMAISQDIPNQVVYEKTLSEQYALDNILLGIISKTGNIPFILAEPLGYADLVVGIDIAREKKRRLPGSMNATAIARIYFNDGQFLRYVIHDAPLEGETIPDHVLQRLFPVKEFANKKVVIHRDGIFRGGEKKALKEWAEKIGATFYLVELIKNGAPRLYGVQGQDIVQPRKGQALKLSDTEAFLVSSLPPFKNATPNPIHVRCDAELGIERAINSILALTLLHYGSIRQPRMPVTIHYSDAIAYMAIRGIKPKNLEGDRPFWL